MNQVLAAWNKADAATALDDMIACCGARRWAAAMIAERPFASVAELSEAADRIWSTMDETDWLEAFACHPRIGEGKTAHATAQSAAWSRAEQASTDNATERLLAELAEGNALYEQRFGFTYIVCATGKSVEEMLAILSRRLASSRAAELREAAEQQLQIMQIRLGKWLVEQMSAITTHVLDAVLGKPAAGVAVRLEMREGDQWSTVGESTTDADGRCRDLKPDAAAGVYRLTFDIGAYFGRLGRASIYPEISITFIASSEAHYHLPLLLSDNSYTTYRGS
jgi:hydroxyisourate hydrolase